MLDKATVLHVAKLARLKITEDEALTFAGQLSSILGAFQELSKVDTSGAAAVVMPVGVNQNLRADVSESRSTPDEILANAPDRSGHLFKVPPVV